MNNMCKVRATAFNDGGQIATSPNYVAGTYEQVKAEMDKDGSWADEFFEDEIRIHGSVTERKIEIEEVDEKFMIEILGCYDTMIEIYTDHMKDLKSRDGSVDHTEDILNTQKLLDIYVDGKKEIEKDMYEDCSNS